MPIFSFLARKSSKIGRKCGKICHHPQLVLLHPKMSKNALKIWRKPKIWNFCKKSANLKKKFHNFPKQVSKLTSPWSQHEKWYITCLCSWELGLSGFCRFFSGFAGYAKKIEKKNFIFGSTGTLPENFSSIGQVIL